MQKRPSGRRLQTPSRRRWTSPTSTHPEVLREDTFTAFALTNAVGMLGKAEKLAGRGDAPSLDTIFSLVRLASDAGDWEGVMTWESRLEDLLGVVDERAHHPELLDTFALANCNMGRFAKAAALFKRHAALCAKMERFRDQAWDFYRAGRCLVRLNDVAGATALFRKARAAGAKHGFFNAECGACLGLGRLAAMQGRAAEAEELLRHAWTVLEFVEDPFERGGMDNDLSFDLAGLLLGTARFEDAGPLIRHLREVAGARADYDARLHTVHAVALAVRFQARRGDVKQAVAEMEVRKRESEREREREISFSLSLSLFLPLSVYRPHLPPPLPISLGPGCVTPASDYRQAVAEMDVRPCHQPWKVAQIVVWSLSNLTLHLPQIWGRCPSIRPICTVDNFSKKSSRPRFEQHPRAGGQTPPPILPRAISFRSCRF